MLNLGGGERQQPAVAKEADEHVGVDGGEADFPRVGGHSLEDGLPEGVQPWNGRLGRGEAHLRREQMQVDVAKFERAAELSGGREEGANRGVLDAVRRDKGGTQVGEKGLLLGRGDDVALGRAEVCELTAREGEEV